MMPEAPRVFISYSHDTPTHKQWVANLAKQLRNNGVDTILDQWDLNLGADVTQFMEEGLSSSDRVLVVCTDEYVRKADAGIGGVGYERMIVTAELVKNVGTEKFIPVIRQTDGTHNVPRFLGARLYADLSDESNFKEQFDLLLREIHKMPAVSKPPLGQNPFSDSIPTEKATTITPIGVSPPIPREILNASEMYTIAIDIARRDDFLAWRQLVKRARAPVNNELLNWRKKYEEHLPKDWETFYSAVDESVSIVAPLFVIALAGIESAKEHFNDQRSLFDDILNIGGWNYSGNTALVDLPYTLGYLYQAFHGAICVSTGQIDLALSLADMQIKEHYNRKLSQVWRRDDVIGWPESLGGNCTKAWNYLSGAAKRFSWLPEVFGSDTDYRIAISAYYMALNIHELAATIADGNSDAITNQKIFKLEIPLCFAAEKQEIPDRAFSMLVHNPNSTEKLWASFGITKKVMEQIWPHWIHICSNWIHEVYPGRFIEFPLAKFFEIVR